MGAHISATFTCIPFMAMPASEASPATSTRSPTATASASASWVAAAAGATPVDKRASGQQMTSGAQAGSALFTRHRLEEERWEGRWEARWEGRAEKRSLCSAPGGAASDRTSVRSPSTHLRSSWTVNHVAKGSEMIMFIGDFGGSPLEPPRGGDRAPSGWASPSCA